jgi:uncharacterized protein (TIGR02217 family)
MSYYIMPSLPLSMSAGLKKSPVFNTVRQKTAAGITSAFALMPFPCWSFEFSLDHIQGNEAVASSVVAQFLGTFMATCGGATQFLFSDPQSNSVVNAQFGIGDGSTTAFQLSRNINGAVDVIQNVNGAATIYVSGVHNTGCSVSSTGVVTFSNAPANGAVLTWTGYFFYLCRFDEDTVDAVREFTINSGIDTWSIQGIKFQSEFVAGTTSVAPLTTAISVNGQIVAIATSTIQIGGVYV